MAEITEFEKIALLAEKVCGLNPVLLFDPYRDWNDFGELMQAAQKQGFWWRITVLSGSISVTIFRYDDPRFELRKEGVNGNPRDIPATFCDALVEALGKDSKVATSRNDAKHT